MCDEEETEHQLEELLKYMDNRHLIFKCPNCETESVGHPTIENPGEELTQIYCDYGCGYLFLEDFKK